MSRAQIIDRGALLQLSEADRPAEMLSDVEIKMARSLDDGG